MRKSVFAAALLAVVLAVAAAGCERKISLGRAAKGGVSAATMLAAMEAPRMYHVTAIIFMGCGVAAWAVQRKRFGGTLFCGGAIIAMFGQALEEYRWFPLAGMAVMGIIVVLASIEINRLQKGGGVVALGVEKSGVKEQVTEAIKEQGEGAREAADYLVKPAKKRLKAAGKI